jgi:hypothetical protein
MRYFEFANLDLKTIKGIIPIIISIELIPKDIIAKFQSLLLILVIKLSKNLLEIMLTIKLNISLKYMIIISFFP